MKLILRILANCAAILVANKYLPGFIFTGSTLDLLMAGVIIGLINALVKPLLSLIALPVILLTLGLFNIVINVGLILLADALLNTLSINSFWTAFWMVIIPGLTNHLVSELNKILGNKK